MTRRDISPALSYTSHRTARDLPSSALIPTEAHLPTLRGTDTDSLALVNGKKKSNPNDIKTITHARHGMEIPKLDGALSFCDLY